MVASKVYGLRIALLEPILGTQPGNETLAADFLKGKLTEAIEKLRVSNPDEAERLMRDIGDENLPEFSEELSKGTTGFFRNEAGLCIMKNYQVKGMLKEAANCLEGTGGIKQLRAKVAAILKVGPRDLVFAPAIEKPEILERPIRVMTMQGPRVSLSRSEMVKAGAALECELTLYELPKFKVKEDFVRELLDYSSEMLGLGQWRNSGIYGRFEYTLTEK